VNPQAYLTEVLSRIATGHLNTQINDLLPWVYATTPIGFAQSIQPVARRSYMSENDQDQPIQSTTKCGAK